MNSGSSTAKTGCTVSEAKARFCEVSLRFTTELPLLSEPVAGSVNTAPTGNGFSNAAPFINMSHGSPSKFTAAAMNLAPSITLPPPTAKIKFTSFSRAT